MDDHESAASPGPERAPEPAAPTDFETRGPSASSQAASESSAPLTSSAGVAPSSGSGDRPRDDRGGYRGFRDRGRGRGGRGRRPPPRGRGPGYDRPTRDEPRTDEFRDEPREAGEFRDPEEPPRRYEDGPEPDLREPEEIDSTREREGVAEAAVDEPEGFREERPEDFDREPARERERQPDRPREPREPRDRGRERGGREIERRDRDRGRRDDRYDRDRSIYRVLRGQLDRIRQNLETVLRDMERAVATIAQAEQDQQLTEQELEGLRSQIDNIQRGGRGNDRDRERRRPDDSDR